MTEKRHARADSQIGTHAFERAALGAVPGEHESRIGDRARSLEEEAVALQRIEPGRGEDDRLPVRTQLRLPRRIGRRRLAEGHRIVDQADLLPTPAEPLAQVRRGSSRETTIARPTPRASTRC